MKKILYGVLGFFILTLSSCGEKIIYNKNYTIDTSINENANELLKGAEVSDEDLGILAAKNTFPATVEITVTTSFTYERYGGPYDGVTIPATLTASGTGFFINEDGYFLTNAHVVSTGYENYPSYKIQSQNLTFSFAENNKKIEFYVVKKNSDLDIAVLKVDNLENVNYLTFFKMTNPSSEEYNDKSAVKLFYGETVFVIGNARGYGMAITRGVVSAPIRYFSSSSNNLTVSAIQTDAAINGGNSGGPLVNKYSCVIGINSFKIASEEIEGMGFAIPSYVILDYIDSLNMNIKYYYTADRSFEPNINSNIN